jgi:hypothetical protein
MASGKPLRPTIQADQNILNPSTRKIGQHLKPEIGSLMLGNVQSKDFFPAFKVYAEDYVHRLTGDLAGDPYRMSWLARVHSGKLTQP